MLAEPIICILLEHAPPAPPARSPPSRSACRPRGGEGLTSSFAREIHAAHRPVSISANVR
jgi:hypothetical protein